MAELELSLYLTYFRENRWEYLTDIGNLPGKTLTAACQEIAGFCVTVLTARRLLWAGN